MKRICFAKKFLEKAVWMRTKRFELANLSLGSLNCRKEANRPRTMHLVLRQILRPAVGWKPHSSDEPETSRALPMQRPLLTLRGTANIVSVYL